MSANGTGALIGPGYPEKLLELFIRNKHSLWFLFWDFPLILREFGKNQRPAKGAGEPLLLVNSACSFLTAGRLNSSQILSDMKHVKFRAEALCLIFTLICNRLLGNQGSSVKLFRSRSFVRTYANIGKKGHKENLTKITFYLSVKLHWENIFLPLDISNSRAGLLFRILREIPKRYFSTNGDCFLRRCKGLLWGVFFNRIRKTVRHIFRF